MLLVGDVAVGGRTRRNGREKQRVLEIVPTLSSRAHFFLTRWVKVLSVVTEQEREERNLTRTASEPDIQMLRDREVCCARDFLFLALRAVALTTLITPTRIAAPAVLASFFRPFSFFCCESLPGVRLI